MSINFIIQYQEVTFVNITVNLIREVLACWATGKLTVADAGVTKSSFSFENSKFINIITINIVSCFLEVTSALLSFLRKCLLSTQA